MAVAANPWSGLAAVRRFFPDCCGTDAQAQSLVQTCFRSKAWSDFDAGLLDTGEEGEGAHEGAGVLGPSPYGLGII